MHTDKPEQPTATTRTPRRWRTVEQLVEEFEAYTPPAIRALIQRSKPHFNSRGEWSEGNGLADAICQPGGKHGKVLVDANAFSLWLESWVCADRVATSNEHLRREIEARAA